MFPMTMKNLILFTLIKNQNKKPLSKINMLCLLCLKEAPRLSSGRCRSCIAKKHYQANKNHVNENTQGSYYEETLKKSKWGYAKEYLEILNKKPRKILPEKINQSIIKA
jgi:hypothetical protein